jgi:hypothetical protein
MPKSPTTQTTLVAVSLQTVARRIAYARGRPVMLDSDLAQRYGVTTKALNQAVRRNASRFPADFRFQLTNEEIDNLRSQFVTSSVAHGGRRYLPAVFTQEGVAMLSSVLRSNRAAEVNVAIMRAFVHLRELLSTHKDLARKIDEMEQKYDGQFAAVFEAIRKLIAAHAAEDKPRRRIGFTR